MTTQARTPARIEKGRETGVVRKVKRAARALVETPRPRWGGRWLENLTSVPGDGEFYEVAEYGPTTAYQLARQLNQAMELPAGRFEFGVIKEQDRSILVARVVE